MYYSERFNAYSHLIGLFIVLALGVTLIVYSSLLADPYKIVANSLFTASLIFLYGASTIYHSVPYSRLKAVFKKLDFIGIYVLIAGSYTPFMLIGIRGALGWTILGIVWGLAIIGIVQEFILQAKGNRPVSLVIYLSMGWIALIAAKPAWNAISSFSLIFLLLGGLSYTIGVYWYVNDLKIKHGHGIWHLFVLFGSIFHIISVYGITLENNN